MIELIILGFLAIILLFAFNVEKDGIFNHATINKATPLKVMMILLFFVGLAFLFPISKHIVLMQYNNSAASNITSFFDSFTPPMIWVSVIGFIYVIIMLIWSVLEWAANQPKEDDPSYNYSKSVGKDIERWEM